LRTCRTRNSGRTCRTVLLQLRLQDRIGPVLPVAPVGPVAPSAGTPISVVSMNQFPLSPIIGVTPWYSGYSLRTHWTGSTLNTLRTLRTCRSRDSSRTVVYQLRRDHLLDLQYRAGPCGPSRTHWTVWVLEDRVAPVAPSYAGCTHNPRKTLRTELLRFAPLGPGCTSITF
jgi:hypothetical protein